MAQAGKSNGNVPPSLPDVLPPPYVAEGELPPSYTEKADTLPQVHLQPNEMGHNHQRRVIRVVEYHGPTQFGTESQVARCPDCGSRDFTKVKTEANGTTHLFAILLLCICWPCAWVPYVTDSCQTVKHHCANCDAYLGEKSS